MVLPREFFLTGIREAKPFPQSKEDAVRFLQGKITARRNAFIEEYRNGVHGTSALTYEPALDREVYKALHSKESQEYRFSHPLAYQEVMQGLNNYTRFQVETFIGERLTVGLSKYTYDIHFTNDNQGILYGHEMDEPLLAMIARGKDTRGFVTSDVDKPRQQAEITQFEQIQKVMGNPKTPEGTTILSFSPPGKKGSVYGHNFCDVFILRESPNGERYVEARRYASGLSIDESLEKADLISPGFSANRRQQEDFDSFFISHPIVLEKGNEFFDNPDQLHVFLQGNPKAMSYEKFQKTVVGDKIFSDMVKEYLRTLEDSPDDKQLLNRILNAVMNRADEIVGLVASPTIISRRSTDDICPLRPIMRHIEAYGDRQVRPTTTGCGSSSGFGQENHGYGASRMSSNMSQFRSTEAASGEDDYGSRNFECPDCHQTNTRPYNVLLPECQHCHSKKVAC